ncbi:MAG: DUF2846 domain-containing protein [Elusimicrobiota bacterium]
MKPNFKRLLFAAVFVSGCASAPHKPFVQLPPAPNTAAVYFFRPSEMTGMLLKPTLSANGAALGKLGNETCAVANLPPGSIALRSQWAGIPGSSRDDSATVNAEAGKNYFVRVRYHTAKSHAVAPAGVLSFEDRTGLEETTEAEAMPNLERMGACATLAPAK